MDPSRWSSLKDTVGKWAKGRQLEVIESLRLQSPKTEATQQKASPKEQQVDLKKKLENLTPQKAEQRYNYLQSRPISELTDAEYDERLELAQKISGKAKAPTS